VTTLVNLTGSPLTLYAEDDPVVTLPSEGRVWIKTRYSLVEHLDIEGVPIPVLVPVQDEVQGLPEPRDGTVFIVTGLVVALQPDRPDLVSPAKIVRGSPDRPTGCRALLRGGDRIDP
jgi:hypothetical protein